jgi:macrolide-specific efflux system membrane fusion protein
MNSLRTTLGWRGALLAIGAVLIGVVLFRALQNGAGTAGGPSELVTVGQRTFASTVTAVGAAKPEIGAEVRVGSRISGRVQRLRANIGDRVKKGDVIAELETAELDALTAQRRAELTVAEAKLAALEASVPEELARAEAELAGADATARLAAAERDRQQAMLKDGATSRAEAEAAHERHLVAQSAREVASRALSMVRTANAQGVRQARAEQERARAAVRSAEVDRSFATIRAPISGVVASVATQEGETVAAGLNAPTFLTIVDLARLQVHAYVDEVDIGKVTAGQSAEFTVDAFPAREFQAKVAAIYPSATLQDNVVKYIVAMDVLGDSVYILRPEMTASVRIQLESRTVLAVPARAIRRDQGESVVYVRLGRTTERRPVRLGWRDGPWVEVISGLKAGERVYLDPPAPATGATP